jgi:GntR family transcriptional regulator
MLNNLTIDRKLPVSIETQLTTQIIYLIKIGYLSDGAKLPTVTKMSQQVGLNHNTVYKSYQSLLRLGYTAAVRGIGTTVVYQGEIKAGNREEMFDSIARYLLARGLDHGCG